MKNKIYLLLLISLFLNISINAQTKMRSPYEGYGKRTDTTTRYKLLYEYSDAYENRDTNTFSRLVGEADAEDAVWKYITNDSFQWVGQSKLNKFDSTQVEDVFTRENFKMDKSWSMNKMWQTTPGKYLYPKYKYIFRRIIKPTTKFHNTYNDSIYVDEIYIYWHDGINYSKYENFCCKLIFFQKIVKLSYNKPTEIIQNRVTMKPLAKYAEEEKKVAYLSTKIKGTKATLFIRDDMNVDNDIVSIYVNGVLVVKNVKIVSQGRSFIIKDLKSKSRNKIQIVVISEGKYPPCTVEGYITETKESFTVRGQVGNQLRLYVQTE
jgi:hypothetical protein